MFCMNCGAQNDNSAKCCTNCGAKLKSGGKGAIISGVAAVVAVVAAAVILVVPVLRYNAAVELMEEGEYKEAMEAFADLGNYKDSRELASEAAGLYVLEALMGPYDGASNLPDDADEKDSAPETDCGENFYMTAVQAQSSTPFMQDPALHTPIAAGYRYTVGVKADGTVVVTGSADRGSDAVGDWTDIVSVAAGDSHTVGLRSDGTVVAVGWNTYHQCEVSGWTEIIAIDA